MNISQEKCQIELYFLNIDLRLRILPLLTQKENCPGDYILIDSFQTEIRQSIKYKRLNVTQTWVFADLKEILYDVT